MYIPHPYVRMVTAFSCLTGQKSCRNIVRFCTAICTVKDNPFLKLYELDIESLVFVLGGRPNTALAGWENGLALKFL